MKAPLISFRPDPKLSGYIETYWRINGSLGIPGVKLLPHYYIELVINFGNDHIIASEKNRKLKKTWINGQKSKPIEIMGIDDLDFMVVRFLPGGARAFIDLPQYEFVDLIVDADLVLGNSSLFLRDALGESDSDIKRVEILNNFFLRRLARNTQKGNRASKLVSESLRKIQASKGKVNISRLANSYDISYRQLLRYFKDSIGISPRSLARLEAFQQAALELTKKGQNLSLANLALENEYFDQSHFIHSFKNFSGVTPLHFIEIIEKNSPMPPGLFPLLLPVIKSN